MADGYSFHVSWYATGLRHDDLNAALEQVSEIAGHYGATRWGVYRSMDDRYKFLQVIDMPSKLAWEKYWYGDEARDMRAAMSGAFQNPVTYVPHTITFEGTGVAPAVTVEPSTAGLGH